MSDTSGFYKNIDGELVYGPNFVLGAYGAYELRRATKDSNTYPVDGWYWFDSEEQARTELGMPLVEEPSEQEN